MPAVTRHPQHTKALLMLLLANAFWGLSFPAIKAVVLVHESLLPGSGNWFVTAMAVTPRYILAALVMLLWQVKNLGLITRGELRQGVELGLFASMGTILQNDGLQLTSASVSAFLTQLYAVLIPALVALRLRRSPGIRVRYSGAGWRRDPRPFRLENAIVWPWRMGDIGLFGFLYGTDSLSGAAGVFEQQSTSYYARDVLCTGGGL